MEKLLKEYLIHCYLYYKKDSSIISDTDFDKLCRRLFQAFDAGDETLRYSSYRKYVSIPDLHAGTGYSIKSYPKEIVDEAETRLADYQARKIMEYQTVTNDPEELYNELKDAPSWFLAGLFVDYNYFLKPDPEKRMMALGVIARILKERKDGVPQS